MTECEQQNPDLGNRIAELRARSEAEREYQERPEIRRIRELERQKTGLEQALTTEQEAHQAAITTAQE